jgi:Tfp pilus assembly protein FimV
VFPDFDDRVRLEPVLLLLSLCFAGNATGLGLGEISVRSHLGQPLHASVEILDAGTTLTSNCFSLTPSEGGIALPLRAQLSLEQTGRQTLLHIRTTHSVYEPIAQFILTSDCEARLQREYVILLDPPGQVTAAAPPVETASVATPPLPRPAPHRAADRPSPRQPAAKTAMTQRPASKRTQVADTAPRLVLSGRRMAREGGAAFALKLDTNLPDLTRARSDGLSVEEMSDENTALTRKLAYLESQLLELQQRNAELEARRATASPPVTPPPSTRSAQWPLYLLVIGLLIGAVTLVIWLRRRSQQPVHDLASVWDPLSMEAETDVTPTFIRPSPQAVETEAAPVRMAEVEQPARFETTEVKDDILDQAEVYMAHGHSELAVHLLQEHLREAPTESPIPWLLLLDLLHREGDTAGYTATSLECRSHFNINLGDHPSSQGEHGTGLEAYPHLLDKLVEEWRSPDIDDFFKDLIYDNRGGTRMGFETGAYRDILLLRAIAQDILPAA